MKNKLFSIIILALLTFTACKQAETNADTTATAAESEMPDYAAFDKKIEVLNAFINAHSNEDLDALTGMLSDTLKWSPPYYNGNKWLGKDDYLAALKSYHDGFDNIQYAAGITLPDTTSSGYFAGSVYPKSVATSQPNGVRMYGTWTAKHTESGKDIGAKWFAVCILNDDNKIAVFTEYFDVHGLEAQIAEE
jgi:limonene-1,2-epoxide hydrolase